MIVFSAPAGVTAVFIDRGDFDPATSLLTLPDDLADEIGEDLVAVGFVNLGSTTMSYPRVVTGQLSAIGPSNVILGFGNINVSIKSADPNTPATGTFLPQRSFDLGNTWEQVSALDQPISFTLQSGGDISTTLNESEPGVLYRLLPTALTGNVAYRLARPV